MTFNTISHPQVRPQGRRRPLSGFTLPEILVVITIILVLAASLLMTMRNLKASAQSAKCLSRLRQSGTLLLASASDNGGRLRVFSGGNGNFDFRTYTIIGEALGMSQTATDVRHAAIGEMMQCPSAPGPPYNPHWRCYGVNFTESTLAGASWSAESIKDIAGERGNVSTLHLSKVAAPGLYVLLADSCQADGQQSFRITGDQRIGLRHSGKANAFMLDGSARSLTNRDLGKLGFTDAFDTRTNPPKVVRLPKGG